MRFRTSPGEPTRSAPATVAVPPSGLRSVVRMDTAVVFPAPLGPSSPRTVPSGTVRSRPVRATRSPYLLTRPRDSMAPRPPRGAGDVVNGYMDLPSRTYQFVRCKSYNVRYPYEVRLSKGELAAATNV